MPDQDRLRELMSLLNNQCHSDKSRSPDEKFFRRTPPSLVINCMPCDIDHRELMVKRERAVEKLAEKRAKKTILYLRWASKSFARSNWPKNLVRKGNSERSQRFG